MDLVYRDARTRSVAIDLVGSRSPSDDVGFCEPFSMGLTTTALHRAALCKQDWRRGTRDWEAIYTSISTGFYGQCHDSSGNLATPLEFNIPLPSEKTSLIAPRASERELAIRVSLVEDGTVFRAEGCFRLFIEGIVLEAQKDLPKQSVSDGFSLYDSTTDMSLVVKPTSYHVREKSKSYMVAPGIRGLANFLRKASSRGTWEECQGVVKSNSTERLWAKCGWNLGIDPRSPRAWARQIERGLLRSKTSKGHAEKVRQSASFRWLIYKDSIHLTSSC